MNEAMMMAKVYAAMDRVQGRWFAYAAQEAINLGRYTLIPGRRGDELYLARFWLTEPDALDGGMLSSGRSVLLHYFAQPDDDGALHDHPWDFETDVLHGGYTEFLPSDVWYAGLDEYAALRGQTGRDSLVFADFPGPEYGAKVRRIECGEGAVHQAHDLHAVGSVDPDTWTLVRTSERKRSWCFHPPGQRSIPWRDFLAQARAGATMS